MTARVGWRRARRAAAGLLGAGVLAAAVAGPVVAPRVAGAQGETPVSADVSADVPSIAARSRARGPHLDTWWYRSLRLGEVHRQATGKGVTIAVIDSGIDLDQPELRGADIRLMASPCLDYRRPFSTRDSVSWHGTAVVSSIVGNGVGFDGPGSGVMGVAPDATILFWDTTEQGRGGSDEGQGNISCDDATLRATERRAARRADIVNSSYSGGQGVFDAKVLAPLLRENRSVLVAAAQSKDSTLSDRTLGYEMPASMPGVVSVNAYDADLEPWAKSDTQVVPSLQDREELYYDQPVFFPVVAAPGVGIEAPGNPEDSGGPPRTESGTSLAVPMVSGTLALVSEKYPEATPNQLIQHLIHHTGAPKFGWYDDYGFGNVFPRQLLANDPTSWPDENPLLEGPEAAAEKFPQGSDTVEPSPDAVTGETQESPPPDDDAGGSPDEGGQSAAAEDAGGGPPGWAWPAGAAVVLAAGGVGAWGFRRGRSGQARTGTSTGGN